MAKRRRPQQEQQRRSSSPNSSDTDTAQSCSAATGSGYNVPVWPHGWKRGRDGRRLKRIAPDHGIAVHTVPNPGASLSGAGALTGAAAQAVEPAPPPRQRYYHWQTPDQEREGPPEDSEEEFGDARADDHGGTSESCNFWSKSDASSGDRAAPAQRRPWCVCCTNIAWIDRPAKFDD